MGDDGPPARRALDVDGVIKVGIDVSAVPPNPTGAGRYVIELVRALERRGNVGLALQSRKSDRDRWEALFPDAAAEIEAVVPDSRFMRLAWEQVAAPRRVDRWGVDVYHGPHYTIPEVAKLPRVVTVHDLTFFDHPDWHERVKVAFFTRAIRAAAELADAIICDSQTSADRLQELFTPKGSVHVAHLGVDTERFTPASNGDDDLTALAAAGIRPPYIGFVGLHEPRKGLPLLVEAFDRIAADHAAFTLVLAGGRGWMGEELDRRIAKAKHGGRIVRPGFLADDLVPAFLRRAAVVAYPSYAEGFGLPALEALACGAPLVTTRGTSMEEVTGDAALLVDPGDSDALAGAIDAVLRGDDGLDRRRRDGLERARAFTWDATAQVHEDVYSRVAASN